MKLLLAYDGSASADAAIDDLPRAGFNEPVEAVVFSVADVWYYPPPANVLSETPTSLDRLIHARAERTRKRANQARRESASHAKRAVTRLRKLFPSWSIHAETVVDWPGWAIIKKAEEWRADLVVVGAGEHSLMERITFGSISRKVVEVCQRSVRVARRRSDSTPELVRLLFGLDGSPHAELAVEAAARRRWPPGSEASLVTALDNRLAVAVPSFIPGLARWHRARSSNADSHAWLEWMMEAANDKLKKAGLTVVSELVEGDPREILIERATSWEADTIFVGACGLSGIQRFLIGSVSSAVAARATCSVEVVRGVTAKS